MMYIAKDGTVSKRRIRVLQMGKHHFGLLLHAEIAANITVDNVWRLFPYTKRKGGYVNGRATTTDL